MILFNSFVVGWEVEWDAANTQDNPVIQAAGVIWQKFRFSGVAVAATTSG